MSQAFDSLLSKIENYYSDADYTVQDAEHLSRIAISEYASTQNALVASARHLSTTSVQKIIDQTIDKYITADPSDWMLFAANAVDNVLNYSQRGVLASGLGDFTDFLPVGHPSRTNRGAMTASALNHAIARWTAADPRIASDQARLDTYRAYASKPGSVEADYASFKLSALVAAGYVPEDISLPITAAFRMSFAMRSAMSKALAAVRRRHRDGRFAEEFGRLKGFFSRGDGSIFSEDARIVGAERGTNNFEVEFSGSDEIPDGIYSIDAAKTDSVKAILSDRAVKGVKAKRSITTPTQAERDAAIPLDEFLKTKKDAPEGWTKNEDGSFTSKTGQTLRQVDTRPEGDYMFEGVGESGAEDATKPFFELKDRDGETIGVAQDWAGANKIAMTYDAFEEDSKPEPEEPGFDQDASAGGEFRTPDAEIEKGREAASKFAAEGFVEDKINYVRGKPDVQFVIPLDPSDPDAILAVRWSDRQGKWSAGAVMQASRGTTDFSDNGDLGSFDSPEEAMDAAVAFKNDDERMDAYNDERADARARIDEEIETEAESALSGGDKNLLEEYLADSDYADYHSRISDRLEELEDINIEDDEEGLDQDASSTDIGPDLERTDSGDLEYYSDTAGADISKVGDKWQLFKSGFEDIEEHPRGVYQYEDVKLFDSEEEAIAEAQKWIDLGKSPDFYDFMYNDWFDGQADGLDQDVKNPNWFDDAVDFDDLDNQDNWKDIGGGAEQYTSPDGKLKLTFEPDGDGDGAGGIVDASGISVEYDGQSVTSFRATARDLTDPGTIADSLSVALGDAKFNPNDLVKADDRGDYEFTPASDVGEVSIAKKYDPNTKKLQWEVTKSAQDLIDENVEHSYFEQKKFDSLDDARADAEAFAQILNNDTDFAKFLNDDYNDRDYDYGFDQDAKPVSDTVKQLADGYGISPLKETRYNFETKQYESTEDPSSFEADGDFYEFGQAVVTMSEYAPGKWAATVYYGDNDGSGQNVLELEESFDSPEEAFEWVANGFGKQFDNSQVAEGILERQDLDEMASFLQNPKYKDSSAEVRDAYDELNSKYFEQGPGKDQIALGQGGEASYKGSDGSTGSIESDGSGTWAGSFTDAEGEVSTRKFKAEDRAAEWLQKKVDDSKLAAFKKENGGLSPKQLEPATSKQYDLLQELFDERDEIDTVTSDAIKDALDNRNLSKSQISALFGDLQKKPFKPGVDSTKPTDRMLNSLQGYLTTKQISPEEMDDILSQLESGLDRAGIEALTNKLRRKPNSADAAGLDQDAPTKPLSDKQLEPASDAQYNYLQSLVESKMDVDADTAAAVAEAATNKNLSKAQAGALIGKLRVLGDKENLGQYGKPSQKMIDSVNRDVYSKGLSEEDRNEILKDLNNLSKGDVSSIISQLKEMPNVPGGLDNYIKSLVEDGDLEALKRLRADVRNEDSFFSIDKAINSLETGEDSGLDQAAPSEPATGPLYDKDEAASLLDEIKAAEDAGEIGTTFLATDTLKDFDSEDIGDAASMYVELDDAIGNVEEGTLRQKLEQFAEKLLSSIQSRLGPVEAAKRDSDDIGSELEFDRTSRRANDLVEFYYPSEGIAFDQLNEPGNNNVGDNRGGGWEARVALDEDEEEETWIATLTSPENDSQNEQRSFENQEDAARWAAENLESNNNELLPSELDEFLSGQIFSTYTDNPQALISKLNDIAEWFRGTRRGDGEDVARGILEYVDRLENLLGDSAPKA